MRLPVIASLCLVLGAAAAFGADSKKPAQPPAPTRLRNLKVSVSATSATLTWRALEGRGVAGWIVRRRAFSALTGRPADRITQLKPGARRCILALKPGRTYEVSVYPYYVEQGKTLPAPVEEDVQPLAVRVGKRSNAAPAAPKDLTAVADGSRVRLSWSPNAELNVAGYEIARKGPDDEKPEPYAKLLIDKARPRLLKDGVEIPFQVPGRVRVVRGAGAPIGAASRIAPAGFSAVVDAGLEEEKEHAYSVRAFTSDEEPAYSPPSRQAAVATKPYVLRGSDLLIIVNVKAKNAAKIAASYARARKIAKPNFLRVRLPVKADMSRAVYDKSVLAPVQRHLRAHPRTTAVLLTRGMPWRIAQAVKESNWRQTDAASVDSELALARYDIYALAGKVRNPLYGRAAPLSPVDGILGVCRLDGPDDRTANALVRRALAGEKRGVGGIAFFDARGLKKGSYLAGDTMIRRAADLMKADGRMTVRLDEQKQVVDLATFNEKIGFYYGWYKGSFGKPKKGFRFGRGAIAVHVHSFAASKIDRERFWVGPLVYHGAAATFGTVYEPYLDGFPTADAFTDALLRGRTFAEAALSANRYLSWMAIHLGDPLYRPFKPKPEPADAAKQ